MRAGGGDVGGGGPLERLGLPPHLYPEKRLIVLQVLLRPVLLESQVTTEVEILPED